MQSISADVDYSLQRRMLLRDVYSGRVGTHEVCDASPYLISASRYHGEATTRRCPICRREHLWLVHYIFGEELRASAGQARSRAELAKLAKGYRHIDVYVVEVCRGCSWNHLVRRFGLGRDYPTPPVTAGTTPLASHGTPRPGRTGTKQP
ncbi:DUF5318 family protein [Stackebrandtia albiflava]|uniref:DUF5318 family protein n=1 Tax=Stackebrandtia albiflava TaxID=406432 RepID=UPI0013150994|nr:DUF5318 family protein [Stackebrandtia albiflava]